MLSPVGEPKPTKVLAFPASSTLTVDGGDEVSPGALGVQVSVAVTDMLTLPSVKLRMPHEPPPIPKSGWYWMYVGLLGEDPTTVLLTNV